MLKTAATKIYWKQETKNRAEFSKFFASSLSEFSPESLGTGGVYLSEMNMTFVREKTCTNQS